MFDFNIADNNLNEFEIALMQSEEYADQIIRIFKQKYNGTQDPNSLLDFIIDDIDLRADDLFLESIERVRNEINNYLEAF